MKILVIGSGGREHALAWKLAQSPGVEKIFVAPGNGGTCEYAVNVDIDAGDIPALVGFARKEKIDLVVPGPELPLTLGICDAMRDAGIACFGPDKYCAQLEGSKSFAKRVMAKAGVPTAKSQSFDNVDEALAYVENCPQDVVIKADGLAAGKGVVVASSKDEAKKAIRDMLAEKVFGDAGNTIVIEERLKGEEVSLLCFCDGQTARPLSSAQDHKPAFDGDKGPNTGGMGAYSPAPVLPDERLEEMTDLTIRPIIRELAKEGHQYTGILYAGLMITPDGPRVLEYNARFGDPECQPLLMRLESDLADLMLACVSGELEKAELRFKPQTALGVVIAAEGYPGKYKKGLPISGLDKCAPDAQVFHSGTETKEGRTISKGGRVLCVTALGDNLEDAKKRAYGAAAKIDMPGGFYRKDIGDKGIARLKGKK